MKAMTFLEPGKMELIDIPEPEMDPEDVLIDIHYVGLCGTDLSTYRGKMPFVKYPRIHPAPDSANQTLCTCMAAMHLR